MSLVSAVASIGFVTTVTADMNVQSSLPGLPVPVSLLLALTMVVEPTESV